MGRQADFVLGEWSKIENIELTEKIDLAIKFIKSFSTIGLNMTMTDLNGK
jgi:PTH1 family peptidyl-tRNA hydrolase